MAEEIKKAIKDISINYEDGTSDSLQYYAAVGLGNNTWFSVMSSPPGTGDKVELNNMLVDLSGGLLKSIEQDKASRKNKTKTRSTPSE